MGGGGVLRGPKIGLVFYHLIPGFRILKCSAHKIHRMLCAFYFLNERCVDGIVGGRDIYQQGLAGVWFVEDRG